MGSLLEFSLSVVEVRPLRGMDALTRKELAIFPILGENLACNLTDGCFANERPSISKRWAAMDVHSIMNKTDLEMIRMLFQVSGDIVFHVPGPHERVCFSKSDCTALHF
ncbi:hypothetical protein Adt_30174 [Abeliophyllum distichum]|uniref:Uncharacterized protein n=1 Tax=Abeliophyllum distichum TaxID=126358 RepID=A0ABD1RAH0_9LAMI